MFEGINRDREDRVQPIEPSSPSHNEDNPNEDSETQSESQRTQEPDTVEINTEETGEQLPQKLNTKYPNQPDTPILGENLDTEA
ncbi:MAG: hypothetical protein R3B38_02700 [Patescibacteria group bacterium]